MSQDNLTTFGIPLARLNKDSAKVGEFYVRVVAPKVKKFQYNSKWSGVQQQGQRFTCHLVGYDDACYLRGEVGGSSGAVDIASNKFLDGTAWKLSKTCLDARAKAAYSILLECGIAVSAGCAANEQTRRFSCVAKYRS